MKTYNEVANSVFKRREQYEMKKKQKIKMIVCTFTSICCVCLVVLLGFGAWQSDIFGERQIQTVDDSVIPGEKDWYGPGEEPRNSNSLNALDDNFPQDQTNNDVCDKLGMIMYNGEKYIQINSIDENDIVYGKKLGNGEDFEGTYSDIPGVLAEIYLVKDKPELLAAKLDNGSCVILKLVDN